MICDICAKIPDVTGVVEVNSSFTAELRKNNNKLTAEIKKIKSRNAGYASEAQKILLIVDNVTTRLVDYLIHLLKKIGIVLSEFLIRIRKKGKL